MFAYEKLQAEKRKVSLTNQLLVLAAQLDLLGRVTPAYQETVFAFIFFK